MNRNIAALIKEADKNNGILTKIISYGALIRQRRIWLLILTPLVLIELILFDISLNNKVSLESVLYIRMLMVLLVGFIFAVLVKLYSISDSMRGMREDRRSGLNFEIDYFIDLIYKERKVINVYLQKNCQKRLVEKERLTFFKKVDTIYKSLHVLVMWRKLLSSSFHM